jgi:hypothetical protein
VPSYSVTVTDLEGSGNYVENDHFATNALQWVNVDAHGYDGPTAGYESAVDTLGLAHFRYPGGGTENVIDITKLENGELRSEVTRFLDWAQSRGTPDNPAKVTIVLPTKTDLPAAQIEKFVKLLIAEYGDLIEALEIGNEYSIGKFDPNYDRSAHPEENPNGDFVSAMDETAYGIAANRVINASLNAIESLQKAGHPNAHDPKILLQIGEIQGAASAFKGNGSFDQANEAIVSWLNPRAKAAVDGGVAHYYYNKDHVTDQAFEHQWYEYRSLDYRIENFSQHLGHEVGLYVTEWNVLASNYTQLGAASASVLLEMFEFMVQMGVEDSFVWPLQHRTGSNIAGNRQVEEVEISIGGTAYQMMADSLRPEKSAETGRLTQFEAIKSDSTGSGGKVEVNVFSSEYQDVLFVSLRDMERARVDLDISQFLTGAMDVTVQQVTIDRSTQDGLADMADENGTNRIGRRVIDAAEYAELKTLAFFDPSNVNHIKDMGNGVYQTYIPPFETIIPLVSNPKDVDDYYFTTETDVEALVTTLNGDFIGTGDVSLDMMPYDFAQITIDKVYSKTGNDTSETFTGGIGSDSFVGRGGNDTMMTGEGNDTLKGGYGDDHLNGGSGDDVFVDGEGNDTMIGGDGADEFILVGGREKIYGGDGQDRVVVNVAYADATIVETELGYTLTAGNVTAELYNVEQVKFTDKVVDLAEEAYESMLGAGVVETGETPF